MTVHRLPLPAPDPALISEMFSRELLDRSVLVSGDLAEIRRPGSWCATGALSDDLQRIAAIATAMDGPGRVDIVDGLTVIADIVGRLLPNARSCRGRIDG